MATVYLEPIDLSFTIKSPNSTLYGTGGSQAITITPTANNITADQNVEEIILQKTSSEYLYQQTGNVLKIYESGNQILSIALQGDDDGTKVAFSNGYAYAKLVSGVMSLGGISIGSAVSAITPTLNTSDSTSQPNDTSSTSIDDLATQLLNNMLYSPSNTSTTTVDSSLKNGIFMDSFVEGIKYKSISADGLMTKEGLTTKDGGYKYFDGGKTEFFIGNTKLGDTFSKEMTTVKDIAKNEQEVTNILRFVQTLDSDNRPVNGITITEHTVNEVNKSGVTIDFGASTSQFEQTSSMLFHILDMPDMSDYLVSADIAADHSATSDIIKEIADTHLGKALSNNITYNDHNYNTEALYASQEKRLKLFQWEQVTSKVMDIEINLLHTKNENIDKYHEIAATALDIVDAGLTIQSLNKSLNKIIKLDGVVASKYTTYLKWQAGVQGFSTYIKTQSVNGHISEDMLDTGSSSIWNTIAFNNFIGGATDFMEKFLPAVVSGVGTIGQNFKVTRPDPYALAISAAKIGNDLIYAGMISGTNFDINNIFTARMWIDIYIRAGMDKQVYELYANRQ